MEAGLEREVTADRRDDFDGRRINTISVFVDARVIGVIAVVGEVRRGEYGTTIGAQIGDLVKEPVQRCLRARRAVGAIRKSEYCCLIVLRERQGEVVIDIHHEIAGLVPHFPCWKPFISFRIIQPEFSQVLVVDLAVDLENTGASEAGDADVCSSVAIHVGNDRSFGVGVRFTFAHEQVLHAGSAIGNDELL